MEEKQLEKAKKDVEEALKLIEDMEIFLDSSDAPKDAIKEKFSFLSKKLQELENTLTSEGII